MEIESFPDLHSSRLCLGSYAFRYAVGIPGFEPPHPLGIHDFLERAGSHGYKRVQICENLRIVSCTSSEIKAIRSHAEELGIKLEIGLKNLSEENLSAHVRIAEELGSGFIRAVTSDKEDLSASMRKSVMEETKNLLLAWKRRLETAKIRIGLENHFDLSASELVEIVEFIGSPTVELVFDTTNSLGLIQKPSETLQIMRKHVRSIHVKDYSIRKAEAGYEIVGAVFGTGSLLEDNIFAVTESLSPPVTYVVELAIRRKTGVSIEEVIQWEDAALRASTKGLLSHLKSFEKAGVGNEI